MIADFRGDYWFLSNFSPSPLTYEGIAYPAVEHAFQAAKTLDEARRAAVVTMTAAQAKKYGRQLPLRAGWNELRDGVMLALLRIKFDGGLLRDKLLRTGNEELVEGNTWGDRYWGVCQGVGQNQLGKLLMQVRAEVRAPRLFQLSKDGEVGPFDHALIAAWRAAGFDGVCIRCGSALGFSLQGPLCYRCDREYAVAQGCKCNGTNLCPDCAAVGATEATRGEILCQPDCSSLCPICSPND